MPKKRVHEIAKANNISSKDAIAALNKAGIDVATASSSVDEAEANRALKGVGGPSAATEAPAAKKPAAAKSKPAAASAAAKPAPARPAAAPKAAPAAAKPAARPAASTDRPAPARPAAPARPQATPARPARPVSGQASTPARPVRPGTGGQDRPAGGARPARPRPTGGQGPGSRSEPAPLGRRPVVRPLPAQPQRPVRPANVDATTGSPAPTDSAPARPAPTAPGSRPGSGPKVIQAPQSRPAPTRGGQGSQGQRPSGPVRSGGPAQQRPAGPGQGRPASGGQGRPAGGARPGARPQGGPGQGGRPGGQRPGGQGRPGGPARDGGRGPQRSGGREGGGSEDRSRREADTRFAAGPPKPLPPRPRPGSRPKVVEPVVPERITATDSDVPLRDLRTPKPEVPAPGAGPAKGAGPKIIAMPDPSAPRPRRSNEGGDGPGRRRVVIDQGGGPRRPGPGGGGPPNRRPRRRRRRQSIEEALAMPVRDTGPAVDIVRINSGSTVKEVAEYFGVPIPEIIKQLMMMGEMATLTQTLSDDTIQLLADEREREIVIVSASEEVAEELVFDDDDEDLVTRPPVVTIMGHVDHGKTSLLDKIRESEVASGEAGGITQHIGAYQVHHDERTITFLDTPGHEAFTAMRARGSKVTDVAVIVVAADDGPRPQTDEAIDHANAADVPIIVAINKIDKEGADPIRVRTQMAERGLNPADWGGDIEFVEVSAKSGDGVDDLLETIAIVADIQELTANPTAEASGVVIESRLDLGRGPVASLLVQRGTLSVGDALVCGAEWAKVRALIDYTGKRVQTAGPGDPVEVLGFDGVPSAGEIAFVVDNERVARSRAQERETRLKSEQMARRSGRKAALEDVFTRSREGQMKELTLILKADVAGSLEAFEDEIAKLPQSEVLVDIVLSGVGGITESDVMLASVSEAIIFGFNVRPVGDARAVADREGVEIRSYEIIYRALEDLRDAMEGMLDPEKVEETVGQAEVRQIFKASKVGTIAGCQVTEGNIRRGAQVRVIRDGSVIHTSKIETLRRFNEDVREVANGYECGIVLRNFQDVREGDVLEVFETRSVERELK